MKKQETNIFDGPGSFNYCLDNSPVALGNERLLKPIEHEDKPEKDSHMSKK